MGNIRRRPLLFGIAAVIILILVGYIISYLWFFAIGPFHPNFLRQTPNYIERYSGFLSHSLGDYEVVRSGEFETHIPRSFTVPAYTVINKTWLLRYERENGEVRNLFLTTERLFIENIILEVDRIGSSHLINEIASNYFVLCDYSELSEFGFTEASTNVFISFREPDNLRGILNPRTGIRLYSVTPRELIDDWGFTFRVYVAIEEKEDYENVIERFEAMVRSLAAYLQQDRIDVRFRLRRGDFTTCDISFVGYFDAQTDSFETQSYRERWSNE